MMAWPSLFVRINDCPWTPKPWEMKVSILKKYGLCPLQMRVLGSHGMRYSEYITSDSSGMSVCLTKQKTPRSYEKLLQSLRSRAKVVGIFTKKQKNKNNRIKILSRQELIGGWTNPVETYLRHFSKPCSVLVKPINQRKLAHPLNTFHLTHSLFSKKSHVRKTDEWIS